MGNAKTNKRTRNLGRLTTCIDESPRVHFFLLERGNSNQQPEGTNRETGESRKVSEAEKAERWTERRTPETKVVESPDEAMENGRHPPEADVAESPDKVTETKGIAGSEGSGVSRRSDWSGRHRPEVDAVKSFGTICENGNGTRTSSEELMEGKATRKGSGTDLAQ